MSLVELFPASPREVEYISFYESFCGSWTDFNDFKFKIFTVFGSNRFNVSFLQLILNGIWLGFITLIVVQEVENKKVLITTKVIVLLTGLLACEVFLENMTASSLID